MKHLLFFVIFFSLIITGCKQSPDEAVTSPDDHPPERVLTTFTIYIRDAINQQLINGWVRTSDDGIENVYNGKKIFKYYLNSTKYLYIYSVGASGYKTLYYDIGLVITLFPGNKKETTFYLYPDF